MAGNDASQPEKKTGWKRYAPSIIIVAAVAVVVAAAYLLTAKFLSDRQSGLATGSTRRAAERRLPRKEVRTYTAEELERARKEGKRLPGMPAAAPAAVNAGEAAVQRSLRTIEEINRINQLNQRLMEQQQRTQNQR